MTGERQNSTLDPAVLIDQLDDVHLDALGLLDEHDQIAFRIWLEQVPDSVRRSLIAEQARLSESAPTIDGVEPPAALQHRVLRAVLEAARAEARTQAQTQPQTGAPSGPTFSSEEAAPAPRRHAATGTATTSSAPAGRRRPRVHRWWRTAAIAASVAVVGVGVIHIQLSRVYQDVGQTRTLDGLITAFGADHLHDMLFDASVVRVSLTPTTDDARAEAAIWVNPDTQSGMLITSQLGTGDEELRLVALNDDGTVAGDPLAFFSASGVMQTVSFAVDSTTPTRFGIIAVRDGEATLLMTGLAQA